MWFPGVDSLRVSVDSRVIFEPDGCVTGRYLITNV